MNGGKVLLRRFSTIRTRLLIPFVALVLLPASAISISSIILGIENGKQQAFEKLEAVASLKATEIRAWLQNLQIDLLSISEEGRHRRLARLLSEGAAADGYQEEIDRLLHRFIQVIDLTKRYDELFLLSRRGDVILSTDPLKIGEFRGLQSYFREGLKRAGTHVQTVSYSSASERLNTVMVVHPVVNECGEAVGVMCGQAKLRMLNALMGERTGFGGSGETYLVGSNHVLMTVSRNPGFTPGMTAVYSHGADAALKKREHGRDLYRDYRNVPVIGVYHWLQELNAVLLAEQDQDEAYRSIYAALTLNSVVAFISVVIAGLAALLFARSIASPLARLAGTASRIAEGNLDLSAEVTAPDEVASLARAFNSMTERLKRRIDMERLVADLSRESIDTSAHETDWAIQWALESTGMFVDADRSYALFFADDRRIISKNYEWCRQGIKPRAPGLQELPVDAFPWYAERMRRREIVAVSNVDDLPHEAFAEREEWQLERVQSLIRVPIHGKTLRGFIGFDSVREKRSWSQEDSQLLRMVGETICSTLERKWMQEELQKSEEKYRSLFESAPDGILITTPKGKILSFNNAVVNIFQCSTPSSLYDLNIGELYENRDSRSDLIEQLMQKGRLEDFRIRFRDTGGRVFPASLSLTLIEYEGETCIQTILRDIKAIEDMEAELKGYAENLEKMVDEKTRELKSTNEELSAAIKTLEETREQLLVSAHQAGMAEIVTSVLHNIGNAITPVNVRVHRLSKTAQTREIQSLERVHNLLLVEAAKPELSELERERKANLLNFIAVTIEILKTKNENIKADLEAIEKGMSHIIEIIAIQQRYAGLRGMETRVNVNELIADSADMLMDSLLKRGIRMNFNLGELPLILLDKNKMIQIFINVIKNAYEAIDQAPSGKDRRISLSTSVDEEGYIRAAITDTGVGLSEEVKSRAFRINFSTKGRGTGFGLHDAANYIKAQGGTIDLLSEGPGKGACVVIRLPISKGAVP